MGSDEALAGNKLDNVRNGAVVEGADLSCALHG